MKKFHFFKSILLCSIFAQLTCAAEEPDPEHSESSQASHSQVEYPPMWRGFYLTAQLGGGWNQSHFKYTNANYFNTLGPVELGSKFDFNSQGFAGGGALGYNFQQKWFVAGLEVGALYVDLHQKRKSPFFPTTDVYSYRLNCIVDVKARLGYSYRGFLPYVTGGWAGGNVKVKLRDTSSDVSAHSTKWANGWTVGAGIDLRLLFHWSLGLAYDYVHMSYKKDKVSCHNCGTGVGFETPVVNNHLQTQLLTARINFHL